MKEYPHTIKDLNDWPIAEFYKDRERVVRKLSKETYQSIIDNTNGDLISQINQTIYAEKLRSKTQALKVDPPKEYAYWKKLEQELSREILNGQDSRAIVEDQLKRILNRYSEEISGNFVPKTFLFARSTLTRLFSALYNPFHVKGTGLFWGNSESLLEKFRIEGPMDHIRELFDKGTVMILPTHFSNLDSILVGYAIEMLTGLPAFSYGAGLNLYDYEILAYYMSRLGAYKVDRRKKNPIYSQAIKQFSTISIQEGLNSIFFPGGTRSRNGMLEKKIKMGLLSTLIESQNEFYLRNFNKKIIIVPLVISYHFVLEASPLIEQYLKRTGKENYLTKSQPKTPYLKRMRFLKRLMKSDSSVTLSFGDPIDIFGNPLDEKANSIRNGKEIDIKKYFFSNGQMTRDYQRNLVYTRHLADELVKSYSRENIVLTSHLTSFVAFQMFRKKYKNLDLFNLVNLPPDYFDFSCSQLIEKIDVVRVRLFKLEKDSLIKLSPEVKNLDTLELIKDGCKNLNVYHFYKPIYIKGDQIRSEDFKLLYYYNNRLEGYKLDKYIDVSPVKSFKLAPTLY